MGIPAPFGVAASGLPPAGDQANAVLRGVLTGVGPTQPFAFRGPMNLAIWASITTTLNTTAGSLAATVGSATGLAAGAAIKSKNVPAGATTGVLSGTNVTLALPPMTLEGYTNTVAPEITGLVQTAGLVGSTVAGPGIPTGTTVIAVTTPAVAATNDPGGGAGSPGSPGTIQISNIPTVALNTVTPQFFTFTGVGADIVTTGADAAASFTGAGIVLAATVQIERSFDGGYTWLVCNLGGSGTPAQWVNTGPISITFGEPEKSVLYRLNCIAFTSGNVNYRISQTGGAAESLAIGPLSNG